MKILVALNNQIIKSRIDKKYGDRVYKYDIMYMEEVIEFLSYHSEPYIVITKDSLEGKLTKELYAKQLRIANNKSRIVYIVNNITQEYKEFLFANEIFNIIEGESVDINSVFEQIDNDSRVIYKTLVNNATLTNINEPATCYSISETITNNKETIAIYGTNGAGKSFISSLLAKKISNIKDILVALLDMDIQNPSIDILNSLECNNNILAQIVDNVDNGIDISSRMLDIMITDKVKDNLYYMTNNSNILDTQNKLCKSYYDMIYNAVNESFDYTIIDLPSSPFLDIIPITLKKATKIFFVINPNYVSVRQAIKYLGIINKTWSIPKNKVTIIINKCQKNSLNNIQIESILKEYKVVARIDIQKNIESYINGAMNYMDINVSLNKVFKELNIKYKEPEKINYLKNIIRFKKNKSNKEE